MQSSEHETDDSTEVETTASIEGCTMYESIDHDGLVVNALITMSEDGDPIGRFTAQFIEGARGTLDADWSTINRGVRDGIYDHNLGGEVPFWPVEEVVDELEQEYDQDFRAINSGPNDI